MPEKVKRPRLLFISPCTPDPNGTGWEQRAFSFLSAYSILMDVELWFRPTYDNPDLLRATRLASVCKSATAFYPKLLAHDEALRRRLTFALSLADCVHIFRFAEIVTAIAHDCVVWDLDELPWQLRDQSRNSGLKPVAPEVLKLAMAELAARVHKCKIVFSCSPLEQIEAFRDFKIIPNSFAQPEQSPAMTASGSLLFVGNMNFPPNIDGLGYFAQSIMPLLPDDVRVTVIGRSPAHQDLRVRLDAFGADTRIDVLYDVPTCGPHYAQAAASIVPLRLGGGTRIKIIESFAHRCPVVSTSKGCEGLAVVNGRELLIEDTPAGFAAACKALLEKPELGERLAKAAYEFFLTEHSQERVNRLLHAALSEASVLASGGGLSQ